MKNPVNLNTNYIGINTTKDEYDFTVISEGAEMFIMLINTYNPVDKSYESYLVDSENIIKISSDDTSSNKKKFYTLIPYSDKNDRNL